MSLMMPDPIQPTIIASGEIEAETSKRFYFQRLYISVRLFTSVFTQMSTNEAKSRNTGVTFGSILSPAFRAVLLFERNKQICV